MTEQEIRDKWEALHNTLTLAYYQPLGKYPDQPAPDTADIAALNTAMSETCTGLDHENFDRIHGALWAAMEQELIDGGFGEG